MLFSVPDFIGFACREVGKINKVIVHTMSAFDIIPFYQRTLALLLPISLPVVYCVCLHCVTTITFVSTHLA